MNGGGSMALKWGRASNEENMRRDAGGASMLGGSGSHEDAWIDIEPEKGEGHDQGFEDLLRAGDIDVAVWDMRRVAVELERSLIVAAVPARTVPWDAMVGRSVEEISEGAAVAFVRPYQEMRLKGLRPDLQARRFWGDEPGALAALRERAVEAAVVSVGALGVASRDASGVHTLGLNQMEPAPGQGALALVCRAGDRRTMDLLESLHDPNTARAVGGERAFCRTLSPGQRRLCAVHAWREGHHLIAEGGWMSSGGLRRLRLRADLLHGFALGRALAVQLTGMG